MWQSKKAVPRRMGQQRKHHVRESYARESSFWQGEREPIPMCIDETHLMPDGTHSHCANAEYEAMLMATLMVFNWRLMLNSGKVDWQKGNIMEVEFYSTKYLVLPTVYCSEDNWELKLSDSRQVDMIDYVLNCMDVKQIVELVFPNHRGSLLLWLASISPGFMVELFWATARMQHVFLSSHFVCFTLTHTLHAWRLFFFLTISLSVHFLSLFYCGFSSAARTSDCLSLSHTHTHTLTIPQTMSPD